MSRTANGATTQFVHDGDRIVLELQGSTVTALYRYGNSLLARNGEVVLADGLGTTRATVDGAQTVTSTLTTEAFGNPVAQWGSTSNPYRFAGAWGYRDDGDAGLLHVGARYYDPQVGRFLSRDAVLSEHSGLYGEHEPVHRVDPSGRAGALIGGLVLVPGAGQVVAAGVIAIGATMAIIWLANEVEELLKEWMREHEEEKKRWRYETRQPAPPPRDPRNEPPDPKGWGDWLIFLAGKLAELLNNLARTLSRQFSRCTYATISAPCGSTMVSMGKHLLLRTEGKTPPAGCIISMGAQGHGAISAVTNRDSLSGDGTCLFYYSGACGCRFGTSGP
ncbi:MAG: RHS repeat-associated core domain-containing protein [bacterium]|nr:RHS repeat-associated core domain-containing protein [bacterium]